MAWLFRCHILSIVPTVPVALLDANRQLAALGGTPSLDRAGSGWSRFVAVLGSVRDLNISRTGSGGFARACHEFTRPDGLATA